MNGEWKIETEKLLCKEKFFEFHLHERKFIKKKKQEITISFVFIHYTISHSRLCFPLRVAFSLLILFYFYWFSFLFLLFFFLSLTKSSKTWNGRLSCRGGTSSNHIEKPSKHTTSNRLSFTQQVHCFSFFHLLLDFVFIRILLSHRISHSIVY